MIAACAKIVPMENDTAQASWFSSRHLKITAGLYLASAALVALGWYVG